MDRIQALSDRRLVSEMGISAPIADDRLAAASANAKLSMVLSNGPPVVRVNIVFLAEGYTAAQEANFTNQAKTVLNQMMSVSPYKEYRSHFNAFAIFVPSVEAGSDHPTRSQYRKSSQSSGASLHVGTRLILPLHLRHPGTHRQGNSRLHHRQL